MRRASLVVPAMIAFLAGCDGPGAPPPAAAETSDGALHAMSDDPHGGQNEGRSHAMRAWTAADERQGHA